MTYHCLPYSLQQPTLASLLLPEHSKTPATSRSLPLQFLLPAVLFSQIATRLHTTSLSSGLSLNVILLRMPSCLFHRRVLKIGYTPLETQNLPKDYLSMYTVLREVLFRASSSTCILSQTVQLEFDQDQVSYKFLYLPPPS